MCGQPELELPLADPLGKCQGQPKARAWPPPRDRETQTKNFLARMVEVSGTDPNSAQGGRALRQGTGGLLEVIAGLQYRARRLVAGAYLHPFSRERPCRAGC